MGELSVALAGRTRCKHCDTRKCEHCSTVALGSVLYARACPPTSVLTGITH